MTIRYTIVGSALGRLLVGATDRGISAVYMGESDAILESALQKEYPRAKIQKDRNGLAGWVKKIDVHLRGQNPHLDLPTDVQGAAFQMRVCGRTAPHSQWHNPNLHGEWLAPSDSPRRFGLSPGHVPPTQFRLSCLAIGLCAGTGTLRATVGESNASRRYSIKNPGNAAHADAERRSLRSSH